MFPRRGLRFRAKQVSANNRRQLSDRSRGINSCDRPRRHEKGQLEMARVMLLMISDKPQAEATG